MSLKLQEKYYKYQKNYFLAINKKNNVLSQLSNNSYIQIGGGPNETTKMKEYLREIVKIDMLVKSNNKKIQEYLVELQQTLNTLARSGSKNDNSSAKITDLEDQLKSSSEKSIILYNKLQTIKQELKENKIEKNEIQEKLSEVTSQGSVNTEIIEKLKSDLENKNKEILELKNEQLTKESLLEKHLTELERKTEKIKEQTKKIKELKVTENNLIKIKEEKVYLEKRNKDWGDKIKILQQTNRNLTLENKNIKYNESNLKKELNKYKNSNYRFKEELNEYKNSNYQLKKEATENILEKNQATNKLRILNEHLVKLKKQQKSYLEKCKNNLEQCKNNLEQYNNNINFLLKENKDLEHKNKNLKSKLSTKNKSRVKTKTYAQAAKTYAQPARPAWNSRSAKSGEYGFG